MLLKNRFTVFKRDKFTCQYCGRKPPQVVLEIDHIIPSSNGGTEEIENLITSCFECNRGKSNIDLLNIPPTVKKNIDEIKERAKQLKEFYKLQTEIDKKINEIVIEVCDYWEELWEGKWSFTIRGIATIRRFLKQLDKEEIKEAMAIAENRFADVERAFRYFCGIVWQKIRNKKI